MEGVCDVWEWDEDGDGSLVGGCRREGEGCGGKG